MIAALISLVLLAASPASPNITGTWQGTMHVPGIGGLRRVMTITRDAGTYAVTIHSLDETDVPIVTHDVSVNGNVVTMQFDMNTDPWVDYHRKFVATIGSGATALHGKWGSPDGRVAGIVDYRKVAKPTWAILEAKTTTVSVAPGVGVEALDWGGNGRPVLLLAGLGNTGHDFFKIVPGLMKRYHVYSMTRRGFGASSKPAPTVENFSVDRLADDVVAVINAFHLDKPVLIGHSIAGEELSDIGTRYPKKIAGLVYLDAGYWYAFNDGTAKAPDLSRPGMPPVGKAVLDGVRQFKGPIDVPILAIFAVPKDPNSPKNAKDRAETAKQNAEDSAQVVSFRRGLPSATVVTIAHADHFVYISNSADVLRDINTFIGKLPKP